MASPYQHLEPRAIRVLKLGLRPNTNVLYYTLHTMSLDDISVYLALSYTWGEALLPPKEDSPGRDSEHPAIPYFEIENNNSAITPNLRDALIQLHLSGYDGNYLWIDAICIDQSNTHEKGIQVPLMGEIFSKAYQVIVWLGKDMTDFENFKWLHEVFLPELESLVTAHGRSHFQQLSPRDDQAMASLGLCQPTFGSWRSCWHSYAEFVRRRRWFFRAWVVQEVAMAREILVQCGTESLSWLVIAKFVDLLDSIDWRKRILMTISEEDGTRSYISATGPIHDFCLIRNDYRDGSQFQQDHDSLSARYSDLENLLYMCMHLSVTDLRDKVYSSLGLWSSSLPPGTRLPHELQPDYSTTSTAETVYTSATSLLITHTPRLSILSLVGSRKLWNLPSWVPDYSIHQAKPLNYFDCWPSVARESPPIVRVSGAVLELRGAYLDTVLYISDPLAEIWSSRNITSLLSILSELCLKRFTSNGKASEEESGVETLWRTMIADTVDYALAPPNIGMSFRAWILRMASEWIAFDLGRSRVNHDPLVEREKRKVIIRQLLDTISAETSDLPSAEEVVDNAEQVIKANSSTATAEDLPFFMLASRTTSHRLIYMIENGNLGLGLNKTQPGDKVWMLEIGEVPFVLRDTEVEDEKTLIGETYLHGFMMGERFERFKNGIRDLKIV